MMANTAVRRTARRSKFSSRVDAPERLLSAGFVEQCWHWDQQSNACLWELDLHPTMDKLLTAGDDGRALVWGILYQNAEGDKHGHVDFEYRCALETSTVKSGCNAAKWSPTGGMIATGYDAGWVYLWRKTKHPSGGALEQNHEYWTPFRSLHQQTRGNEVFVLEWSPDHRHLIAGTGNGKTIIWDVLRSAVVGSIDAHAYRGCGIALDPLGGHLVTVGDDQKICFYTRDVPAPQTEGGGKHEKHEKHEALSLCRTIDSNLAKGIVDQDKIRAVRRGLRWSPDSIFLVVPSAYQKVQYAKQRPLKRKIDVIDEDDDDDEDDPLANYVDVHGCHVYAKGKYDAPFAFIPAPDGCTPNCVAFSPVLYKSIPQDQQSESVWGALPYRMFYAVSMRNRVTRDNKIFIYDTARAAPLVEVANLHHLPITQMQWSRNGMHLFTSARDGFVSVQDFNSRFLGDRLDEQDTEAEEIMSYLTQTRSLLAMEARAVQQAIADEVRAGCVARKEQQRKRAAQAAQAAKDPNAAAVDAAAPAASVPTPSGSVNVLKVKKRITPVVVP